MLVDTGDNRNSYILLKRHAHITRETCTCYPRDMHMLPERHVHVTQETCTYYPGDMHR